MSVTSALQKAIGTHLIADTELAVLVGSRIYDGVPSDAAFPHIEFGASDAVPYYDIDDCVQGYEVALQIDCWSSDQGALVEARAVTDAVCASLRRATLSLDAPHKLIEIRVNNRVFRDADLILGHGVVTVEAEIAQ